MDSFNNWIIKAKIEMPVGPEAEKMRVAGDFILEKSKPKTIIEEQVKSKGIFIHRKEKMQERKGLL